jgi:hypothetical protein
MNYTAHTLHVVGPLGEIAQHAEAIFDSLRAYISLTPRWDRCSQFLRVQNVSENTLTIAFRTSEGFGYEIGRPVNAPELGFLLESADEGHHYENIRSRVLTHVHPCGWKPSWCSDNETDGELEPL